MTRAMYMSKLYAPTLKEDPADAELASHRLLLRAGMIRKEAAGLYSYLPLAWRSIRKIENIVRDEMDAAGAQELMMPIMVDAELWRESGRIDAYGKELVRFDDRHGREFVLGPTHEETVTALVRNELRSYKQLPVNLYHIQDKFRDERRPRFGLMRSREFIMKDLYSFDKDVEGMNVSYQKMYDAYTNIYNRMGLAFRPVEADNGAIGGGHSHEFTVLADAGESNIAYCPHCDYAASDEKAELAPISAPAEDALPLEKVATPGTNTIESLCSFLQIPAEKTIKAVAYQTDADELVLVFLRGDHEVNEVKVKEVPALDDEFAKDVSEFDTLKELKADIKKKLTAERTESAQRAFEDVLMAKVAEGVEADVPHEMVELQAEQMTEGFKQQLASQGIPFDQYLKMTNTTEADFKSQAYGPAEQQVKMDLAISAIVKAENLEATDDEVEAEMKKVADRYGMDLDTVKKYLRPEEVKEQVIREKVIKLVADNAVAGAPAEALAEEETEAEAAEEKKPAKKAAAKKPAAKKTAAKKTTVKKPAAKKTAAKKPAVRKAAKKSEEA